MADYINNNAGMDWDDAIENDGQEFIILPEGDYNFTVTDFERGRFPGSAKMSACNKATLTLQVKTDDGIASVRTDLILNRVVESAFPLSSAASVRRSMARGSSWTGTRSWAAADAHTSNLAPIPTVTATSVRRTMSTASMTMTRNSSPQRTTDGDHRG